MRFEKVPVDDVDWSHLDAFEDRTFSQRSGWLEFVRQAQRGEIVVARLIDGEETVGYFTGIVVRRFGVRIMGSPFALFARMESSARRAIRKSEKCGVTVEEASPEGFADEYYAHLVDVFAKQQLRPTYDRARVERLIRNVHPSGDLLLLRARDPDGRSIASGIFPGYNRRSYFWGNGSLREHQILRPNEAIHWSAMRYWRGRGMVAPRLGRRWRLQAEVRRRARRDAPLPALARRGDRRRERPRPRRVLPAAEDQAQAPPRARRPRRARVLTRRRPSVRALANMRPARIERATSASAGLRSIP